MSDLLDTFQRRHQEKLGQLKRGVVDEAFLDETNTLITDLRQAGTVVANPAKRGQLRALMRFWGNVVYDHTGVYPDTMLQPLDPRRAPPPEEPARRPPFPLVWMLVGGAAVVIIAVGLFALTSVVDTSSRETATPMPVPLLSYAVVGTELNTSGALKTATDTFCLGSPEIIAEFALEGIEPEMEWRWEMQRDGVVVDAQPATPWGKETQRTTIRTLVSGSEGVEPGQYDLLIYVGEQVVGGRSFQVLDTVQRVFNLRVADVPEPAEEAPDEADGNVFEAGVRVIYLSYEYEGLCPGLDVSHTLYHEGRAIQENTDVWSGAPQGRMQVGFQAPGDQSFSPGDCEVAVAVAGEEQARVGLTIGKAAVEEVVPPAFSGATIALGVQPDGTPIITAPDNVFDWNTKVVYGIFEYVGMSGGLRWAAVWMRYGREVAQEEYFWDVGTDGAEGTHWVAYHNELGRVLSGGNYSVTLYIDGVVHGTTDFRILYYVPRE